MLNCYKVVKDNRYNGISAREYWLGAYGLNLCRLYSNLIGIMYT